MNEHPSILTTSDVSTLAGKDGREIRSVEIVTDGRVGAQADAEARAREIFRDTPSLSFRKSYMGELRFYYTDRPDVD